MSTRLRDLILITLVVTIVFLMGYILIPIMSLMPLAAYKAIVMAPIYGFGITFLLTKIPKVGVVSFTGILLGLLLSVFTPFMLAIPGIAAVMTETCCYLVFGDYKSKWSKAVAGGLFPAFHIPITLLLMGILAGGVFLDALKNPLFLVVPTVLTFFLGLLASLYGLKVWKCRNL